MDCYKTESLLIDYIDEQLNASEKRAVEQHLQGCESCSIVLEEYRRLFGSIEKHAEEKPGPALREKFDIMLKTELAIATTANIAKDETKAKVLPLKQRPLWLSVAASVILVVMGAVAGMQIKTHDQPAVEITELRTEIKEMKEALLFSMLNEESASDRIQAVSYADEISNPDSKVINALLGVMNEDKNVNVRLAALYSIARYADQFKLSDSLVASLKRQTEPLMQIALINILTEKKENKAVGPIKEILQDKRTLQPVKEIAAKGLHLL
ncbi:zf-HC2 domain-containing protein [Panacibacter sp. DH6]|uniref:Zf-HC2 domain-containing protein n=1 Tax=Panacibacter microcysteis TaxID=2793269 RepID=A0A931MEK4_9BACT|nr:zf-HC2 domain-containing protein [Panacibacter microcysteis]MBG9378324.1 zf-HC2 domain-containing protein [Panacibacter microcysteis]